MKAGNWTVAIATMTMSLAISATAFAQVRDTVETRGFARPTVFVVLDSSGSMEFLPTVREVQDDCRVYNETTNAWDIPAPAVDGDGNDLPPALNRFATAVEVLVGEYPNNMYCAIDDRRQDRDGDSDPSWSEAGLNFRADDPDTAAGARVQGFGHVNYCVPGPFAVDPTSDCDPTNVFDSLGNNGILDGANRDEINFIYAAYDSYETTGRDISGMFSYGDEHRPSEENMAVNLGIRNRPDSGNVGEGRLIQPFRSSSETVTERHAVNADIQESIVSTTPFGGTPLAAVLRDVHWFFGNDYTVNSPISGSFDDGTGREQRVSGQDAYGQCRPRNMVLVTDGIDSYGACDAAEAARCTDGSDCTSGTCAANGYCACTDRTQCASTVSCVADGGGPTTCQVPGCAGYEYQDPVAAAATLHAGADGTVGTADDVEVYVVGYALEGSCSANPLVACFDTTDCTDIGLTGICLSQDSVIDDIACAGSGGGADCRLAYIADNASELTTQLQRALNDVIGGEIARTPTVTTNRTLDVLNGGSGGQYRVQATTVIDGGSVYWTGELQRTRLYCDSDLNLLAEAPEPFFSDELNSLTVTELTTDRNIYTNNGRLHRCAIPNQSPFAELMPPGYDVITDEGMTTSEVRAACCVGSLSGQCGGTGHDYECSRLNDPDTGTGGSLPFDSTLGPASCMSRLDFGATADLAVFGAISDDAEPSEPYTDCTNDSDCAGTTQCSSQGYCVLSDEDLVSRLIGWVHGYSLQDIDDQLELGGLDVSLDRTSRMGAFFHSTPALVGGADAGLPINGYETFREQAITVAGNATDGVDSEIRDTVAERWTMAYALSGNGLIHAFNAEDGTEAWAFLPNSVLNAVEDGLVTGTNLAIDGTPVVRDLRVHRGTGTEEEWRTVLVTGFRGGGRGYVALDVTDPQSPNFLWELDAETDPRIGMTYGEPALGTVFLDDCGVVGTGLEGACERGVAILGGGMPPGGMSTWLETSVGDVLYVVDILTGTVLFRQTTDPEGDELDDIVTLLRALLGGPLYDLLFDTGIDPSGLGVPITGAVAPFDDFAGGLLTRAFVGDGVGRLWRLDLSSGDPGEWDFSMFFDPRTEVDGMRGGTSVSCEGRIVGQIAELLNPSGGADVEGCDFEPIFFRPTVSLRNGSSNAVVVYGFGDTDNLETTGGQNYVLSLDEAPIYGSGGTLASVTSSINWMLRLDDGEKLTTRPRIFNSVAYFATFLPNAGSVCDRGSSRVYGLHFTGEALTSYVGTLGGQDEDDGPGSGNAIIGMLPDDPSSPAALVRYWGGSDGRVAPDILAPHSTVFGLDIIQSPRCIETTDNVLGQYGGGSNPSAVGGSANPSLFISESVIPSADDAVGGDNIASVNNIEVELQTDVTMVVPFSWGYPVGN